MSVGLSIEPVNMPNVIRRIVYDLCHGLCVLLNFRNAETYIARVAHESRQIIATNFEELFEGINFLSYFDPI